jgi:hypothetical protein
MTKELDDKFTEFYDGELRDTLFALQGIVMAGKKLTDEDVGNFWKTFKTAQKEAFMNGAKSILD